MSVLKNVFIDLNMIACVRAVQALGQVNVLLESIIANLKNKILNNFIMSHVTYLEWSCATRIAQLREVVRRVYAGYLHRIVFNGFIFELKCKATIFGKSSYIA